MKIIFIGIFAFCCLKSANCQSSSIQYVGPDRENRQGHIYNYNGQNYWVPQSLYDQFQSNPEAARQRFLSKLSVTNRFGENNSRPQEPSNYENSQGQRRPADADSEAQSFNTFKPNKPKNPSAVTFREPSEQDFSSRFPEQNPFNGPPQNFGPSQPSFGKQPKLPHGLNQSPFEIDLPATQDTGYSVRIPQRETQDRGNRAITEFAWRLFKGSNTLPDYVLSPMSPQILLSYLAWVAEGRTREELVLANGYGSPAVIQKTIDGLLRDGAKRELQIATAFFVSKEMRLNQEFLDKSVEKADVVNVDFKNPEAASKTITRWAKQKTKGGLKLDEINYAPSTKIALTSAVYFKANWIYKFNPAQPGTFYTPNGPIQVDMMNMKRKFRWGKLGEFAEWAAIPYESEDSLIIILPNRDQTLENVINIMEEKTLIDVLYDFDRDSSNADVNITLPKFKLESTTSLVQPLKKMGIQTLFSPRAELPYLSNYDSVQVSNAQQQASIDVNEEGTVVISFTNLNVVALSFTPPVPSVDFVVNRPFLAVVANRNRNIPYVIAKITNPTH